MNLANSVVDHFPIVHTAQGFLTAIDIAHRQSRQTCARSCRSFARSAVQQMPERHSQLPLNKLLLISALTTS
jgi:hypothetical protein